MPTELVFDQGFGDLFIVRVAGKVISGEVVESLRYALGHLRVRLFVVMGHEGCGAVQAALASKSGGRVKGNRIRFLLRAVLPALEGIDARLPAEMQMLQAVEANVRWAVRLLAETSEGQLALAEKRATMVSAGYGIRAGRVRYLAG